MADSGPYFVGDSIAQGLQSAAKGQGDTKVGRSPTEVLHTIATGPDLTGRNVVLSSGISNNPGDIASVQAQIAALKAKGAANISVVGVGPKFGTLNPALGAIAAQNGATFSGGFQAGSDGVHPANYGHVLNTAYPPPNQATTAPGAAYPPPNVQPVSNEPSIAARGPSQLDLIAHVETGNRNIPQQIHDVNTDRGTPANGVFQFIDPTWRRMAPKAGVDITRYPTAMSAPPEVQAQVARVTPINQWGPNTVAALKARFPGIDTSKPPSGPYNGVGAPAPATTPAPAKPATQGNLLSALFQPTGTDGKGLSPVEQAGQAFGKQQPSQSSGGPNLGQMLQQQQAAAPLGMARQQQLAAAAQQATAVRARGMQPISWGSGPPGSDTGPGAGAGRQGARIDPQAPLAGVLQRQQLADAVADYIPGTTLNSLGDS